MKFTAYSFNEDKKEITLEGIVLDHEETGVGFGINVALVNGVELFFDNITGMVLYGSNSVKGRFTKEDLIAKIRPKNIANAIASRHNQYIMEGIILPSSTEKIKVLFPKQNIIVNSGIAGKSATFMSKFNLYDYFKSISYQNNFGNQSVGFNAVIICPVGYTIPMAREEKKYNLSELKIVKLAEIPTAECLHNNELAIKNLTDIIHTFTVGRMELAKYIPENNVLIMSNVFYVEEWAWLEPFFDFLKKFLKKRDTKDTGITIGCDPEFELYDKSGHFMNKDHILSEGRLQRKIGADGHGDTLELRPEPSEDPAEVVADLVNLFDSLSHLRVSVKGDKEALGGHIHFGAPQGKIIKVQKVMLDALDSFIGNHFQSTYGSARRDYGRKGDNRTQPWGFEYRTPPAAIFTTKEIAYITMKLAKGIVEEINRRNIEVTAPLSKEDLYQFLTKEETEYYWNFPKNYEKLHTTNIIEYWTKVKESPIKAIFYDEWDNDVKAMLENEVKNCICDLPTTICFYGTDMEFAGLKSYNSIPHKDEIHCNEGIAIGIPLAVRRGATSEVKKIAVYVKQKIVSIVGTKLERTTETLFPEELIGSRYTKKITKKNVRFDNNIVDANIVYEAARAGEAYERLIGTDVDENIFAQDEDNAEVDF